MNILTNETVKKLKKDPTMKTAALHITSRNMAKALGRSVRIPAPAGHYIGRGLPTFQLSSMSNPVMLGNDAMTEVYFTTSSGNLYKVWQDDDSKKWLLANVRHNQGRANKGKLNVHTFPSREMESAVLTVGSFFSYGNGGRTSEIVAILAVNASRCYTRNAFKGDLTCDIRKEFDQAIS